MRKLMFALLCLGIYLLIHLLSNKYNNKLKEKKKKRKISLFINIFLGLFDLFSCIVMVLIVFRGNILSSGLYTVKEVTAEGIIYNINISKEALIINGGVVDKTEDSFIVPLLANKNEIKLGEFPKNRTRIEITDDVSMIKSIKREDVYTLREDLTIIDKISAMLFTEHYDFKTGEFQDVYKPKEDEFIIYLNRNEIDY